MNQTLETPVRHDTKEKILDAAERLFADHGFAATPLRQITAEAGVNLAAVNYHFHSKEALLSAVLERKVQPVNVRRIELLDQALSEAGESRPSLKKVIRAFIQPVFEARGAGIELSNFSRLMARLASEPDEWAVAVMSHHMKAVVERFIPAFGAALGVGNRVTVAWAAHLSMGTMAHSLMGLPVLNKMTGFDPCASNPAEHLERLISYIAGGMRALAERERSR
jgi:AcrR family transcriptional regulator